MICNEFVLGVNDLSDACALFDKITFCNGVVLLQGDLGSGKTTFVRAFVRYMQQDDEVTSPTFNLVHEYGQESKRIYHYDLYRKSLEELLEWGLLDMLEREGIHLVEWGDERLETLLRRSGYEVMRISIALAPSHQQRIYKVF